MALPGLGAALAGCEGERGASSTTVHTRVLASTYSGFANCFSALCFFFSSVVNLVHDIVHFILQGRFATFEITQLIIQT